MNSLELAFQMKSLTVDYCCGFPQPPESLSSSLQSLPDQDCAMDFDLASSFGSQPSRCQPRKPSNGRGMVKGWGSAISRSRCVNNLSSLGSASSESSNTSFPPRSYNVNIPSPGGSWGYYADTTVDR